MMSRIIRPFVIPALFAAGFLFAEIRSGVEIRSADAQVKKGNGEFNALAAALVLEKTLVKVIAKAEKSIVGISRIRNIKPPKDSPDPTSPDFIPNDFGSGIIIAPDPKEDQRFILTNYHVVKGGPVHGKPAANFDSKLYVRMHNRRGFYASIIAADPRSDLAVLRIDFGSLKIKPRDLQPLPMGKRDRFRKGQLVIALGNPYAQARDGSASASWGMISNISRRPKPSGKPTDREIRRNETIHHSGTLLQVDTRLNIGTSGGALLNLKGELIGITTSLAALSGYESSAGYAVPLDRTTRRIVTTLSKGLEVEYGYLGIAPRDVAPMPNRRNLLPANLNRQHAAMAGSVHPNSPAAQGGVRQGDVFLNIDGNPVYNRYDLMRLIGLAAPGTRIRLDTWREGSKRRLTLFVRLGKWPVINDDDIVTTAHRFPVWRGIRVDHPTARHKFLQLPYRYHHAVVVLDVTNPALKKSSDLQPGDYVSHVNGSAVQSPAEFHAAVRNVKGAVTLRLISGDRVRVSE